MKNLHYYSSKLPSQRTFLDWKPRNPVFRALWLPFNPIQISTPFRAIRTAACSSAPASISGPISTPPPSLTSGKALNHLQVESLLFFWSSCLAFLVHLEFSTLRLDEPLAHYLIYIWRLLFLVYIKELIFRQHSASPSRWMLLFTLLRENI